MQRIIERSRTSRHEFIIIADRYQEGTFEAEFRPLNLKTGEPWQASRRISQFADLTPEHWDRPIAYSTLDLARKAIEWKKAAR